MHIRHGLDIGISIV